MTEEELLALYALVRTTHELLGDRFAYTLAVHTPLAKDNIEQPHMNAVERSLT